MRIVAPAFFIDTEIDSNRILKSIERAGRVAYKSEDHITEGSAYKFVKHLNRLGHHSVIEHESITVRFICDRAIANEIVRHRIASYTQESSRYCNYSKYKFNKEIAVIKPCFFDEGTREYEAWKDSMLSAESFYFRLLALGASPEKARTVLPMSLKTEIVATMNLRGWKHFLELRTSKEAHPQIREIAQPLLERFNELLPEVFTI